jgi:hypothetical protein
MGMNTDGVFCADCAVETYLEGGYRVCPSCGTRTRQVLKRSPRIPKDLGARPRPSAFTFTGGGPWGACLVCGNAHEECECEGGHR